MTVVLIITIVLLLLGIAGAFLPFLPGPPLSWVGLLVYAIYTDFERIGITALIVFGILSIIAILVDVFAPVLGARGYKASRYGLFGAFLGGLLGIMVIGPFGFILGPLIGAFAGEYLYSRDEKIAWRTAWGSMIGLLVGTFAKVLISLAMIVYFGYIIF